VTNFLRGTRPLIIGLIAACTALGTSVATATAASTSAGAATASAAASAHAAVHPTTSRLSTLEQLAMLRERAKLAAHGQPAQRGAITGTIVGVYGQPIAGACVTAIGSAGTVLAAAAPDGTFRLAGLAPGSYVLEYRDCAAAGRYATSWSGGAGSRRSAAHVQVTAGQVRHVPVMMLRLASPAALQSNRASWQRMVAAADGRGLSAAAAAKTGKIKGIVTGMGKPLRGICVITFPTNGGVGYAATTSKDGSYTIGDIKPGRYDVTFAGPLCPTTTNWLMQTYRNDNNPFGLGATAVEVTSGKTRTGIDGHLRLGGEISGMVTSTSGHKLAGICVTVTGQVPHGLIGLQTQTGRNGSYHLHALYPGKWSLQFSIGCGSTGNYAPAGHRAIRIRYGQDVSGIDAALGTGGTITGKVTLTTSSGEPLSGICVFASNNSGSVNLNVGTNTAGRYRVIGLGTGKYQMQFSPGCDNNGNYTTVFSTVHATAGKVTSGANAVLQVGGVISGTVTDSHGKPVPGTCIELDGSSAGTANVPESTGSDGSYVINQLSAGTYQLGFFGGCGSSGSYAPNWYDNQSNESQATPIKLAVGATFTANAQLQPGATISGKVTNAAGHGLSGLCVGVATETDAELGPIFEAEAGTTRGGAYSIPNLAPGQYLVNFGCGGFQAYANQWFGVAPGAGAPELVSAGPGRTGGIDGVLRPAGTISGVVTSNSGHPLEGICVATPRIGQPASIVSSASGLTEAITDSRGAYQIAGLAGGSYLVQFSPCAGAFKYAEQWYRDKASIASATIVRVRAGKTTRGIDGRLVVGGSISGRVVDVAAKPLRNICVFANDAQTASSGLAITGKAGTYTVPGLSTGSYVLEVGPCTNQNLITVLTHAKVTQPHAVRGVDVTLHPGGTVAGVVTATSSSGPPVPGTCVEVISSNPANVGSFAITGANGSYQATGLATGSYQVYFGDPLCPLGTPGLAPQWYDGQSVQAKATPVAVTAGQTTPSINAALQPDGEITGAVSAGPSDTPLSGACVTAVPLPGAGLPRIVAVSRAGGYALADLLPGRYKVEFSAGCGATGYKSQWWKDASSQAAAKVITVVAGQTVPSISATLTR
jgi:hypothetical protein